MEYIHGQQPVRQALLTGFRKIRQLIVYDNGVKNAANAKIQGIIELAQSKQVRIQYASKTFLDGLCFGRPHQNIALQASHLPVKQITDQLPDHHKNSIFVYIVNVLDPQNVGSLIRSGGFFGVDGIWITPDSSALTPTVSKASSGVLEGEYAKSLRMAKLNSTMDLLRLAGWNIAATICSGGQEASIGKLVKLPLSSYRSSNDKPLVLVLGSEGSGLPPSVLQKCTHYLSLGSKLSSLDSLNVAVAGAVILSHLGCRKEACEEVFFSCS